MPEIPHINFEPGFSRAPSSNGLVFQEAQLTNQDQDLESTSYHREHRKLLEALQIISQHQSPIEYAYFLSCINEYLKEIIQKKENKFKKREHVNDTFSSEVTSVMNYKFQAIQDQYQSFYGNSNLSRMQSTLTNPYHNGSIIPTNNFDVTNRAQSSVIGISRNNMSAIRARPQKFSRLEDTFGSVKYNGESYIQNNSIYNSQPGSSRFPGTLKTGGLHSSFFSKSRDNLSSFQSVNNIMNGNNETETEISIRPNETIEDKFSCVRVVTKNSIPTNKAQLPTVKEAEEEAAEKSDESSASTASVRVEEVTKRSSRQNNEFILKNWTVILRNESIHLKGIKLSGDSVIEKSHISEEISYRLRNGKIKTKDETLYVLEDSFVINDEMPLQVKKYFKNKKFPLTWRTALKTWIAASKENDDPIVKNKIKPCRVVLEHNGVAKLLKNLAAEKKSKEAQVKDDENKITKNSPTKQKINEISSSCDSPPNKMKKTKINQKLTSENGSVKKKSKENSQKKSQVKTKEKTQVKQKDNTQAKKNNVHPKKKENSQAKLKESARTKPKESRVTEQKDEIETERGNVLFDLFGDSVKTPLHRDVLTPSALLNSIKKNPNLTGRHTPPLKMVNNFIENKKANPIRGDISIASGSKENPVAKRMAKTKTAKKVLKNENKSDSPNDDKIDYLVATLKNRTPQTTPKSFKEVFRKTEESDSDFGSDISSISS